MGHSVTILEALHEAGGVLVYGIPEFRLPKDIVKAEVDYVRSLGADLLLDAVVGRQVGVKELLESGYDAVFLGIGAGAPRFLNVPGAGVTPRRRIPAMVGIRGSSQPETRRSFTSCRSFRFDITV